MHICMLHLQCSKVNKENTELKYIFVNYTEITKVNLSVFGYMLFHEDFSSMVRAKFALTTEEISS